MNNNFFNRVMTIDEILAVARFLGDDMTDEQAERLLNETQKLPLGGVNNNFFNRISFEDALAFVEDKFGESAPTVAGWCNKIYVANDRDVSLADLHLLWRLYSETMPPSLAANLVRHRMHDAG